ncbi:MAG: nucleotidyltransferase domain-containing protein [Desulfobacula sp.]|nr:nucleotidyltransferase domain-containing protein [Desulfobacula sp.]
MDRSTILNFIKTNSSYLHSKYNISKIGLIGSFARNEQNDGSDIDFLIEFKSGTQDIFNLKLNLKEYLKTNLNRDIDICREKYLKPYAKDYILNEVIYA